MNMTKEQFNSINVGSKSTVAGESIVIGDKWRANHGGKRVYAIESKGCESVFYFDAV